MPKELFNQTPITTPTVPDDNDRVAFGQPSVAGGKNMLWSYFKTVVKAFTSLFEWIDFTPQTTSPTVTEGRIYYDDVEKVWIGYTDIPDSSLQFGEELRARLLNDTGATLLDGKAVSFVAGSGGAITVELLDCSDIDCARKAIGLMTVEVLNGANGYTVRFGRTRNLNTSSVDVGDTIFGDPLTAGEWTNTKPLAPYYPVRIGYCTVKSATIGEIFVDTLAYNGTDTDVNSDGILDGIMTETPDVAFVSNGTTITATVTNQEDPGDDLHFLLDGVRYDLPIGSSVTVPPGADASTLQSSLIYAYLNAGVPTLEIATTPPSIPYVLICEQAVFNATRTQTDGRPFSYRRSNNSISSLNGVNDGSRGLIVRTLNAIRKKLGSNWLSGQDATTTVNNTTIRVAMTAGVGMQFNEASLPLFDGLSYIIYNNTSNLVTYANSTNLTDIVTTAAGVTLLANNSFYTIRLFYMLNSNGIGNSVIATRPLGKYSTSAEAIQDSLNYTVNVNDTNIEEIIYPLYDIVISRTGAGGTTIALVQLTDLRTKLVGGVGGGGASGGGGTDDKVRISATDTTNDYLNPKFTVGDEFTTEISNPAANEALLLKFKGWVFNAARTFKAILSFTGTADRTYTFPDISGLFAVFGMTNPFSFGGQAHGGSKIVSFSAAITFSGNDGNNQYCAITGDTTLGLSNLLPGMYVIDLYINTATPPTITIGATFGDPYDNSPTLDNTNTAYNTITVFVNANSDVHYTINTIAP